MDSIEFGADRYKCKLIDVFNVVLISTSGKSAMTNRIKNLGFVTVCFQSYSACLFFQIDSHLTKVQDSVREQKDVINVLEVLKKR